jgi:hypothetical protein
MFDRKSRLGASPSDFGILSETRRYPTFGIEDPTDEEVAALLGNPKVQSAVGKLAEAKLKEEHQGLLDNREEFRKDKEKLEGQVASLQEAVKNWEGLDPAQVREVMANIEASEEAKLVAAGKTDEVVKIRTERLRSDYETKIKKLMGELDTRNGEVQRIRGLHDNLRIETATNAAILKDGGIADTAPPDILPAASRVFSVADNGDVVAYEGQGDDRKVVMGKDGETPLSIDEWLSSMKPDRPHWWKAPVGGGAAGTERDASSGVTGYTAEQIRAMDPQEYRKKRSAGEIR